MLLPIYMFKRLLHGLLNCQRLPPLQDSLGFPPSRQAMAVVQSFVQAQAARQQQWALSRLQHAAVLTARRCAAAPLYGQDMREVYGPPFPPFY